MTITLTFDPPADFINANDRLHHHAKAPLTRAWRAAGQAAVLAQFLPYHMQRAHIVCTIRFPDNRRRDVGNYFPTAKALVDGLVDAKLLHDDNDKYVLGPDMRREYPNGPARVTLTVKELCE